MRDFSKTKRIVIKIGTNTLTEDTGIDAAYVRQVAAQVTELLKTGKQALVISSGAIGMGAGQLDLPDRVKDMKMRQACAAIGQPLLMQLASSSHCSFGIGLLTISAQFFGSGTGPGFRVNGLAGRNSGSILWTKLDHCQSAAVFTIPARRGLASMCRMTLR